MGRKTLKLPEEEFEGHNQRRKEMGLSWTEYINAETEAIADVVQSSTVSLDRAQIEEIAEETAEKLAELRRNGEL